MQEISAPGFFSKNKVLLFTGLVLLVNILQAFFTGLANDEAYYWMYARRLDIGYFDHPPMIAAMIKAGYALIGNELGLRLFVVLSGALLIPVLYQLCGKKDFTLFALLVSSITVFHVYGFIAVPDAPLIFFTALFFLVYRYYLERDGWKEILLLTLIIALLLYSKYHGILVLFFTFISNLKLLRKKSFYLVITLSILLYSPHILWQISNDYPSYQYHVLNKSQTSYNPMDTISFLGGILFIAGPFAGVLLIYSLIRSRSKELTERAMRFTFIGFVIFFLFSTLNAAVEANWMAASMVPLLVVGHNYISEKEQLRKWTIRLSFITMLIFLFARINLVTDIVPAIGSKALPELYGWDKWADEVEKHAAGRPVVIMNSYQKASKYSFYKKTNALSLNNIAYRRNQFDIWDIVDRMQGKNIALFMTWAEGRDSLETFDTPRGKMQMLFIDDFHSYTKIRIETEKDWYHFKPGQDVEIPLNIHPGIRQPMYFKQDPLYPVSLVYDRYYYQDFDQEIKLQDITNPTPGNPWKMFAKIHTPEKEGPYYLRFSIKSGWMPAYINSHLIRMDVEK